MEPASKVGKDGVEVARRLRQLREDRGLTVRELSEAVAGGGRPILPSGIVKLEGAQRRIDIDDLTTLATALEVAPATLLSDDFDVLERERVDLTRIRHRPELRAVSQAVNGALDAGVTPEDIQSTVRLTVVMHEMTGGK